MTIRVLIVDDSPTMRALLAEALRPEADIQVVGTAVDAREARTKIKELNPDVVTLDIEMPGMSGLEFLEKLMTLRPTPVVIVSGLAESGSAMTVRALEIGAVECYAKPSGAAGNLLASDQGRLAEMIRNAAQAKVQAHERTRSAPAPRQTMGSARTRLIAIGASTGGVEALHVLLSQFPADCPPTMIVQHINGAFAEAVARRLDTVCAPKVMIAEPDLPVKAGHVYIAPGTERHLEVRGNASNGIYVRARPGPKVSGHRPSVDMLFHSVAENLGRDAIGIQLTGMGSDGAQGLLAMAEAGAMTIAQDESTSVVFGMPGAAIALGAASMVAPIHRIAQHAFAGNALC
ncbi:protein-glutamate methylesterase/protein-glutamine glutaminase [Sphingomonas sp. 35-24ZXX]|uniref:protein-glutamate methylesterase/protein-glutamine glutaminase n=1 Tax=Sphingomonas sp. 35-24ZXX TaxID=1545915 RepID=UPI00053C0283|nr:chemotaxis response regulator protein-glutamate methylesterase [Sphingomonas sp. 35-24ZXX]